MDLTRASVNRRIATAVLGAVLAIGTLTNPAEPAWAATTEINPTLFRLPDSVFPSGSIVPVHRVETNDLLATESGIVHFGPSWTDEGRLTGYFAASTQITTKGSAASAVLTSYLVSIFASGQNADGAFNSQRDGYEKLRDNSTMDVTPSSIAGVGDDGYQAFYSVVNGGSAALRSELFFATGPVLVEVWQSYDQQYPGSDKARASQTRIAASLDAIARSALQDQPASSAGPGDPTPGTDDPGAPQPVSLDGSGQVSYIPEPTPVPVPGLAFSIFQVRVERDNPQAAYDLTKPGLQRAKIGATVNLAVYFSLRNVPPRSVAMAEFKVQRGRGVYFFYQCRPLSLATYPNTYRITVPYTLRLLGKSVVTGRVSINGFMQESSVGLRVLKSLPRTVLRKFAGGSRAGGSSRHRVSKSARKTSSSRSTSTFAAPLSVFPSGSQVRVDRVESNSAAEGTPIPHLDTRTLAQRGRETGYYMDTVQLHRGRDAATQYLVSVFRTTSQARSVFQAQQGGYRRLSGGMPDHYRRVSASIRTGNAQATYLSLTPLGNRTFAIRETFFYRGRVLVQVAQSSFLSRATSTSNGMPAYMSTIAGWLDAAARRS